jgi:ribonuclease VapC
MPNSAVLDSFALLAFLKDEPGQTIVEELLRQSSSGELRLGVAVINLGEVWYRLAQLHSPQAADQAVDELLSLRVELVEVDWELTRSASAYKMNGGLSFADCFAAALARAWNATLVTGDPEFKRVEREIEVRWLKRR